MNFSSERVQVLMAEKKLSTVSLASKSGLSRPTVTSALKRGTCNPITLGKMADGLGVKVADIIRMD